MEKYILDNDLDNISKLIEHICLKINKYIIDTDLFSSALYEVIINAIEHGNLNILYEQKKEWLQKNIYNKKLKELLKSELAKNTNIELTLDINENDKIIIIKVKDNGEGFNIKRALKAIKDDGFARESGRGIIIIKSYFDEVKHNKKGNVITLIKKFNKNI
ncbi:ATP-binding protein [Brachyspira pilosicoli]|uniref:ATP-binding protein n=1 Tax=Brachyspira pilosicoli TaxID=52584 RepID=A0A5C8FD52_BRAPL|nr:ATP-binding protein [Brachyspira pilosicoli]TXJ47539.1 ATP-binding protein [Brachyspira pilosicoli]